MKLALALVAALSLAACVEEPSDPAAGLYGVGIGKAFQTDPSQLVSPDQQPSRFQTSDFNDAVDSALWIEQFTTADNDKVCQNCELLGLHMEDAIGKETLVFTNAGKYLGYMDEITKL